MKTRMQEGIEVLDGDQEFTVYFSYGYSQLPIDEESVTIQDGTPVKNAIVELGDKAETMMGNSNVEYGWYEPEATTAIGDDNRSDPESKLTNDPPG